MAWQTIGSYSGRGSAMTESFLFEGGVMRVRWETRGQAAGNTGPFRLSLNSAVSGRELAIVADGRGPDKGEAFVPEEPRPTYMLVETSDDVTWSVTVEEGHPGTVGAAAGPPAPKSPGTH